MFQPSDLKIEEGVDSQQESVKKEELELMEFSKTHKLVLCSFISPYVLPQFIFLFVQSQAAGRCRQFVRDGRRRDCGRLPEGHQSPRHRILQRSVRSSRTARVLARP